MSRNQPKRYLPFAASPAKKPLLPAAPVPKLLAIARSVRDLMGGSNRSELALGARAFMRIRSMMQLEEKAEIARELARKAGVDVDVVVQP